MGLPGTKSNRRSKEIQELIEPQKKKISEKRHEEFEKKVNSYAIKMNGRSTKLESSIEILILMP